MKKMKAWHVLALILVFGLSLRLLFFSGFLGSDDIGYYDSAYKIIQNKGEGTYNYHSARIGITYPTAFFYKIFGINEFTSNLLPLITSLLSMIVAYKLGKLFFGEKTGIVAALLLSFYPVHVSYSSILLPDFSAAFFISLGILFFFMGEKKRPKFYYMLCGLSIGVAYLMQELSLIIVLFFLGYAIYKRRIRKEYFFVVLGVLIIFLCEMGYSVSAGQSPMFRFEKAQSQSADFVVTHFYNYFGPNLWLRWFVHYPYVVLKDSQTMYFFVFFFIAILYFIIRRKKETYALLIWAGALFLYLNFGTNSLARYIPLPAIIRYLDLITIPCIVLLAYFLAQKRFESKKAIVFGIISLLLIASIFSLYLDDKRLSAKSLREAANYLSSKPPKKIYSDSRTSQILKYLFAYQKNDFIISFNEYSGNQTKIINTLADMGNVHDAYVVINEPKIKDLSEQYSAMQFPKEIFDPPKDWILKKEIEFRGKIKIYYVP